MNALNSSDIKDAKHESQEMGGKWPRKKMKKHTWKKGLSPEVLDGCRRIQQCCVEDVDSMKVLTVSKWQRFMTIGQKSGKKELIWKKSIPCRHALQWQSVCGWWRVWSWGKRLNWVPGFIYQQSQMGNDACKIVLFSRRMRCCCGYRILLENRTIL